jgi:hypothetical protein
MRSGSPAGALLNVDWLYYMRQGKGFGRGASLAASVGNIGHVQLLNPAASGVTILLKNILVGAQAQQAPTLRTYDTALATLVGAGVNLSLGGAAGQGVIRTDVPAAGVGTLMYPFELPAFQNLNPFGDWIAVLAQGKGILVQGGAANLLIDCTFCWVEV